MDRWKRRPRRQNRPHPLAAVGLWPHRSTVSTHASTDRFTGYQATTPAASSFTMTNPMKTFSSCKHFWLDLVSSQINDHIWCYWDLYSHASLFIVFEELILAYFFTGSTIPRRERGVHLYCHWLRTTAPPLKDDGGRVCLPFAPTPRHPTATRTIRASAANTAVIVTGARPAWTTLSTSWLSGST